MSGGTFGIIEAARSAWQLLLEQRAYIVRIAALPVCAQVGTTLALRFLNPEAGVIESFLWNFPATVLFAWLMFAEARFVLAGERLDRLPQDAAYLGARLHAMQLGVLFTLIFNMAVAAATAWLEWAMRTGEAARGGLASAATFGAVILLVWGLRFSVMHIVAAAGYPPHVFLRRVRGAEFSLRLLGMGLLCALPVYLLLMLAVELAVPDAAQGLTDVQSAMIIIFTAPVTMFVPLLMNAAAVFALKELMGRKV